MTFFASLRRRTASSIIAVALALPTIGLSAAETTSDSPTNRPNVIFFFSDQQRWDTVSCYGQKLPLTPNLDRMAGEGVRFEFTFTCQPVCGPARSCLQTGKYATETGCFRNNIGLPTNETTIAQRLSAAGYEVGYLGKWHLASTGLGDVNVNYQTAAVPVEHRGGYKDFWLASDVLEFTSHSYDGHLFDARGRKVEFPGGRYRVDAMTDFALEYLRGRNQDRPLFLFISYIEPHHQNDHGHFEGPHGSKQQFADFEIPGDLAGAEGDWKAEYPDYLGAIHSLDENLGRLRDGLDKLGMAQNTLVIYTADHGCHFRTRNREYKRSCHEASIRVPLVACGPGFHGGKVVSELVSLIDVPPTILAAADVDVPESMRGRPLQPLAAGTAVDWPQEVFVQISESQVGRAIRTKRWKYGVDAPDKRGGRDPSSDRYVEQYLYDLDADPHERNNLVADPSLTAIRAKLAATLKRRMADAGESVPVVDPAQ